VAEQKFSQVRGYRVAWWTTGLIICRSWVRAPPAPHTLTSMFLV
jgi:hypothetical protein